MLPVVYPFPLIAFRMDSTNLPPESENKAVLILKDEDNTLDVTVISSNMKNLKMMHCVISIIVCKNGSPLCRDYCLSCEGLELT